MPDQPVAAPADRPLAGVQEPGGRHRGAAAALRRLLTGRAVRWGFVLVAAVLGGLAVRTQWSGVRVALAHLGFVAVAGAMVAVLLAMIAAMQVWRVLLAGLGSPLPARAAARVVFIGQLGKYVPGSIWAVLAQVELGRAYQVPRRRSAAATLLTMLFSLTGGLLAAVLTLPLLGGTATSGYRWAFLLAPVLLASVHPRVLNPLVRWLLRLTRRPALEQPLTLRAVAGALSWALVSWLLYGAQIWLLAVRLGAPAGRAALLAVGGFAFAWSVGFLAVFAPAGVGVREVLLVAVLGPVLGTGDATAIALVSRLLMTVGDLAAAGLAAGLARRGRGGAAQSRTAQSRTAQSRRAQPRPAQPPPAPPGQR